MASMSGFRAIEDFAKYLRPFRSRHWLVPASVVGSQVSGSGLQVIRRDALCVGEEAVLVNQPAQMLAVLDQAQEEFLVEGQIFRDRGLPVHSLFFLAAKQLHFVEPYHGFA